MNDADRGALASALAAAKRGDVSGVQADIANIGDPAARKLAQWAMIDAEGEELRFFELDQARRDLAGWPRAMHRQLAAEKTVEASGLDPARIVAWFGGAEPQSAQGAMALAAAYQQLNRTQDAQDLIRRWWRNKLFEADVQNAMLTRFGAFLTQDDHIKRTSTLLYGPQGPAARDMLPLLPPDQRALAEARLALRAESGGALALADAVPEPLADDPGLAVDRARYLTKHDLDETALRLVRGFPADPPNDDAASRIWTLRRSLIATALRDRDYEAAYAAADKSGLSPGVDYSEAEFYAGWLALRKLHNPTLADQHFAHVQMSGATPITQARALYWRGRAAEEGGDIVASKDFYSQAGLYQTTFYGQLAAEKAGIDHMVLGHDPVPSPADIARFNGRDEVRAARMLGQMGEKELFRTFILALGDSLPDAEEYALLVDLARTYADQDLAMRAVRLAAQHGYVLPERGYPLRAAPSAPEAAEAAFVFGITRQESNFDPYLRSGVGARGMMQLMPGTAAAVARRIGEPYRPGMLDDPDYNMRLGASYLGHMVNDFTGSYVLAAAAYNAGPGRPADWVAFCGDPRTSSVDPVDFIECIPFSETRNYVMRVLEAAQVYRARLNGGAAPLTLAADLKRGGYVYSGPAASVSVTPASAPGAISVAPGVTVKGAVR